MNKEHKKEVARARVVFAIIILLIAAVVVVAVFVVRGKMTNRGTGTADQDTQIETQIETQEETEQIQAVEEETEEVTETEEAEEVFESKTCWTSASDVNFRAEPNTDCEVYERLARRTELTQIGETDGFAKVVYNDKTGYVSLDLITYEEPAANSYVICLDPGHQTHADTSTEPNGPGSSTMKMKVSGGTVGSFTGVAEYQLNLDIGLQLKTELEARGYTVYMTRTSNDVNLSNKERAEYATSVGADITVRIHANGADSSSTSGACMLCPSSSNPYIASLASESYKLSDCILTSYCAETGIKNTGVVSSDTMTGINWSTMPVTLIELGYMTNQSDDVNMEDAAFQVKMVQGIADGIDAYFGL